MISHNNASEFPSTTPCEEEDPEPYSLIVVVCSGKIQLQHKASCYRGHGYSNTLNSLQGCTTVQPTCLDLQGGRLLVRNAPPKLSDMPQPIPGSTERPSAGLYPMRSGSRTLTLHAPTRCVASW